MEPLDIKFGKYTLVQKIGDGGMAEVYKARVEGVAGFQKMVALKKIHPSLSSNERFQQNFVNEARLCGQLHHHNVVEVYEFDRVQDAFYLAMEFIDGINLEDLQIELRQRGERLPNNIIASIMIQTLEGLAYAHTAKGLDKTPLNVIHRDLKPSNILIDQSGVLKIVDFGVAKADMNRYATQEMTAKGTASYMAPEQVLGKKKLTFAVDVFSAGAILFELLTDERLFDGDHVFAILKQVATSKAQDIVARLPERGQVFAAVLEKMLTKEPEERAPASELLRDFKALGLPNTGTRSLGEYLDRLDEESEDEGQATIIDLGGSSRGAPPPIDDYDDDEDLFETGPTKVAFLPIAPKRTSLGPGAGGGSPIKTVVSRPSAFNTKGKPGKKPWEEGGFNVAASDDGGFEDDVPTRMTTGPTLVQRSSFELGETTQDKLHRPSRSETTKTNPYPKSSDSVDLVQETARMPRAQGKLEATAPKSPKPSPPRDNDIGQKTVVLPPKEAMANFLARAKSKQSKSSTDDITEAAEPQAQNLAGDALGEADPPQDAPSPSFSMSTGEGDKAPNHLLRALTLAAVILVAAVILISPYFSEYQVTLDFSSVHDAPSTAMLSPEEAQYYGVEIFIDGQPIGRTQFSQPITFKGPSQSLFIEARQKGFRSQTQTIQLTDDSEPVIDVSFNLEPIPQTVKVTSQPAGAMIFINGESKNRLTPSTIDLPAVGRYELRLEKDNYQPLKEQVMVSADTPSITYTLRPAN